MKNQRKNKIIIVVITIAALLFIAYLASGCSGGMRTPPWTEEEVEQMESDDIKTVPILQLRF